MKYIEGELGRERKFSEDTDEVIFINNTSTNATRHRMSTDKDHFNGTISTCMPVKVCLVVHVAPDISQMSRSVREHCIEKRKKERPRKIEVTQGHGGGWELGRIRGTSVKS